MTTQTNKETLNKEEVVVLKAVVGAIGDCTDGEFGFSEDVSEFAKEFTKHQVAGYLGSLVKKGYVYIESDEDRIGCESKAHGMTINLKAITEFGKELNCENYIVHRLSNAHSDKDVWGTIDPFICEED